MSAHWHMHPSGSHLRISTCTLHTIAHLHINTCTLADPHRRSSTLARKHMHTSGSLQVEHRHLHIYRYIHAHFSTVTHIKRPTDAGARTTDHPAVDCSGNWRNLQLREYLDEKGIVTFELFFRTTSHPVFSEISVMRALVCTKAS